MRHFILVTLAAVLIPLMNAGCAAMRGPAGEMTRDEAASASDWRSVATEADRSRIRTIRASWDAALASARANGHAATIAAEGALLSPTAALPNAHIPPGDYRCRVIKLGMQAPGGLGAIAYPHFDCRIAAEQDIFSFTKLSGSQRPVGLIFPDTELRKIFLGTLMLGDERRAIDYGADAARDMAGVVERVGSQRWRIVFPRPAYESLLDVIELVPAQSAVAPPGPASPH